VILSHTPVGVDLLVQNIKFCYIKRRSAKMFRGLAVKLALLIAEGLVYLYCSWVSGAIGVIAALQTINV